MTFKIHFNIGGEDDEFTISGETLEEIRLQADKFFTSRGLDATECGAWSEEL